MVRYRKEKIDRLANRLPLQEVSGDEDADLLVVGWGGTAGALKNAVSELRQEGKKIAYTHFHYISPLPKNTGDILKKYKKIVVCELNMGQFVNVYNLIRLLYSISGKFRKDINNMPIDITINLKNPDTISALLTLLSLGIKNIKINSDLPNYLTNGLIKCFENTYGIENIDNLKNYSLYKKA